MMASPPTEGEEGEEQILVLVIRRFTILKLKFREWYYSVVFLSYYITGSSRVDLVLPRPDLQFQVQEASSEET